MTLRQRILILAIPVYVMGVIVWRFALHQSWTLSLQAFRSGCLSEQLFIPS